MAEESVFTISVVAQNPLPQNGDVPYVKALKDKYDYVRRI